MENMFISKLMITFYKTDIFIKYNLQKFVNIKIGSKEVNNK